MKNMKEREGFSSGLGLFFATLGSAVGLGNIWKFPYVTGVNGGAAFLVVYLLCIIFVGLPVMISEFYIGRKTKKNIVGALDKLQAPVPFKSIGVFGILVAYLILFFYSDVAGWVYSYVFKALKGDFAHITVEAAGAEISNTIIGPIAPILWQIVAVSVVSIILIMGVQKGIEKITKTLLPILFILIIICVIRALTLPGATEGIKFLFKPDFSKVTPAVVLSAMGLAFFKLSLGMGTMTTYGSYFTEDNNMIMTSIKVALSDISVSLLAGIAIFPTVFSFNMKPDVGPSLLFVTIPMVFSKMPFGNILLIAFFGLTAIASTTAMISMVEVLIAYFTEERGISRTKAVVMNGIIIITIGSLATLSADSESLLSGIKIFGFRFFDLFDYISQNILLPLGGFIIALFVGYFVKKDDIEMELSNQGTLSNSKMISVYRFILRYITPILLVFVFLSCIGIIKF